MERRNIKEELKKLSGANFNAWYNKLTKEEKIEYNFLIEASKNR